MITIKRGILHINDRPVLFPRDAQNSPVSVLFGITSAGSLIPLKIDEEGRLVIQQVFEGTIDIGDVVIKGVLTDGTEVRLAAEQRDNIYVLKVAAINLDIPISELNNNILTRASEQTLQNIKNKLDLLRFDESGRLLVSQVLPEIPPEMELVDITLKSAVSGTAIYDYVIPQDKKLILTKFACGAERSMAGSKGELYFSADGTNLDLITVGYVNGSNYWIDLNGVFGPGDGVMKLRIVRERLDGGAREIFVKVTGYLR